MRVVVIGGTGRCGRPIVKKLLASGHDVTVPTRDPSAARALAESGAELLALDLLEPGAPGRALQGADRAYLITTSQHGFPAEVEVGRALVRGAHAAGLDHVVLQSVTWADSEMPHCQTKGELERELAGSPVSWTSIRAGYFSDTLPSYLTPEARGQDQLISVIAPEAAVWWVSVDDLARAAVSVLTASSPPQGIYDAVAKQPMSFATLTAELSRITGRRWSCTYLPISTRQVLLAASTHGMISEVAASDWLRDHPRDEDDYHAAIASVSAVPDPTPLERFAGFAFTFHRSKGNAPRPGFGARRRSAYAASPNGIRRNPRSLTTSVRKPSRSS